MYCSPMDGKLEISVAGRWVEVTHFIFRSWRGDRRVDGVPWVGPVFYYGSRTLLGE